MKFYIPMKPHKWGFKLHLLCDADIFYVYNILFDPSKNNKEYLILRIIVDRWHKILL